MQPLLRVNAFPEFTSREFFVIAAMTALMTADDLLFSDWLSKIDTYLAIDYAKKALLLAACFATRTFRAAMARAFAAPDIPWAGPGWLNPHVAILLVGTFLFDQGVTWMDAHINDLAGNPAFLTTPAYRDDLLKYFDLTFGLLCNAVAEEAFYRAILIAALFSVIPRAAPCVILAGLVFGLVHWSQGPISMAAIAVSGLAYGVLFCLTRSIIPGIAVHYLDNVIAFAT